MGSDGADGFVIVWRSAGSGGTDSSGLSVQGQLYSSDGSLRGQQFQVNTTTLSNQLVPVVGSNGADGFVVVWESDSSAGTDSDLRSIQGQLYSSDGSAVGGEFQVNTSTMGYQLGGAVSADSVGGFVVTWYGEDSGGTDSDAFSIQGRRYRADGTHVGGEFQINTFTTDSQIESSVVLNGRDGFSVAWASQGSTGTDNDQTSIQVRRYLPPLFLDGFESGDLSAWSSLP